MGPPVRFVADAMLGSGSTREGVPRRRAAGKVPPHVYDTREEFASCPGCGRIYWNATHRARMKKYLEEALRPG